MTGNMRQLMAELRAHLAAVRRYRIRALQDGAEAHGEAAKNYFWGREHAHRLTEEALLDIIERADARRQCKLGLRSLRGLVTAYRETAETYQAAVDKHQIKGDPIAVKAAVYARVARELTEWLDRAGVPR